MDLDTWACPVCFSRLTGFGEGLRCVDNHHTFRRSSGLPVFLAPEDEGLIQGAHSYAAAWKRDRWAPRAGQLLQLPYVRERDWKQKARSFEALLKILGPAQGRTVGDMGAGTGWLSYRLAETGFRCYATDISSDPQIGLGAAIAYDSTAHGFERAIASLMRWPFLERSIDVAICNASLHYAADTRPVIEEATRVLRPGGEFIVLNSPVHRDRASAGRAAADFQARLRKLGGSGSLVDAHRHFVAPELEAALARSFSDVRRHDIAYGFWFRATRAAKGWLLRMELASFPIYQAHRR